MARRVGLQLRSVLGRGRAAHEEAAREPSHLQATTAKTLPAALAAAAVIAGALDELGGVVAGLGIVTEGR